MSAGGPPGGPDLTSAGFLTGRVQEQCAGPSRQCTIFQAANDPDDSFENGPNGPLVPELKDMFPNAPYIPRPGNINAWDNEDFVNAVQQTGRKQLIIAGVVTEVCVAFPALSAIEAGYDVFVVTDASGTFNEVTRHAAWARMATAGVQLMSWFGVACELHRDWRNDIEGLGRSSPITFPTTGT